MSNVVKTAIEMVLNKNIVWDARAYTLSEAFLWDETEERWDFWKAEHDGLEARQELSQAAVDALKKMLEE